MTYSIILGKELQPGMSTMHNYRFVPVRSTEQLKGISDAVGRHIEVTAQYPGLPETSVFTFRTYENCPMIIQESNDEA